MTRVQTDHNPETNPEAADVTIQSDNNEADINLLMKRHTPAGLAAMMETTEHLFADVTDFQDYTDVMREARRAEESFMTLPSKVRELFHHDAAEWLDCAHDEEKLAAMAPQLEKLGLIKPGELDAEPTVVEEPPLKLPLDNVVE